MKLIIAYIQPEKLSDVKEILYENEINHFSVSDSFGHGEHNSIYESYRGVEIEVDLIKKIRIEVAVNDDFVDCTVDSILKGGKSGKIGDGKIFVLPVDDCYRIATGDKGNIAIG